MGPRKMTLEKTSRREVSSPESAGLPLTFKIWKSRLPGCQFWKSRKKNLEVWYFEG